MASVGWDKDIAELVREFTVFTQEDAFDAFEKSEILSEPKRIGSSHWLVEVCRQTRDGFKRETTCFGEKDAINTAMHIRANEPDAMIRVTEVRGVAWRNF